MSEYTIDVDKAITVCIDYEEYTFDSDQAAILWELLGKVLGKDVGGK